MTNARERCGPILRSQVSGELEIGGLTQSVDASSVCPSVRSRRLRLGTFCRTTALLRAGMPARRSLTVYSRFCLSLSVLQQKLTGDHHHQSAATARTRPHHRRDVRDRSSNGPRPAMASAESARGRSQRRLDCATRPERARSAGSSGHDHTARRLPPQNRGPGREMGTNVGRLGVRGADRSGSRDLSGSHRRAASWLPLRTHCRRPQRAVRLRGPGHRLSAIASSCPGVAKA